MIEAERDGTGQEPLYRMVKRDLVADIDRGAYEADQPFISQREVCERFGVSSTTAVRALNELVTEGYLVRQRGRGTFVAERSSPPAGTGAGARERTVACVMHGQGPHQSAVLDGIESVCGEEGLRMFLSNSKGSKQAEEHALRLAMQTGAGGVVLYPIDSGSDSPALAELARCGVPVVMIDRYHPESPSDAVVFDNYAVGFGLTEHLVERGHRRIATLWDETDVTSVAERLTGHVQALRKHGIPVSPELTALTTYHRLPDDRRLTMLSAFLDRPEPPTVLLCANGHTLAHAARDLSVLGLEVPGQIELAGMDDAGPFDLLPLTVAAARLPSREMGRRAMELLAQRIRDPDGPHEVRHVLLPVEIRTRDSAQAYLRVVGAGEARPAREPVR
ncbi:MULTISPECIES: LacI family DNA-binding transcriptional regulator [unclassified Streptomyces]|uniref:LacI family DNA-binding transcriptional regulator n=1 Tax=unclassified Streptomyces TaxID=2593676 RepID=UPI0037F9878C